MAEQKSQAEQAFEAGAQAGAEKVAKEGVKRAVRSGAGKAVAQTVGTAAGAATGGAGKVAAMAAEQLLSKKGRERVTNTAMAIVSVPLTIMSTLVTGVTAVLGTGLAATGIITGAVIIGLPIVIALILFIINSGAYLVPPATTTQISRLSVPPSGCFFETPNLLCGSYDSSLSSCRHGSDNYWLVDNSKYSHCQWSLPVMAGASCKHSPHSGNVCYNANNQCAWYGFAADFNYLNMASYTSTRNLPAYLPTLEGQVVNWTPSGFVGRTSSGSGGMLRATANGRVYEMYLTHLTESPLGGTSGSQLGTLFDGLLGNRHIHTELRIDGEFVRPEEYFCTAGEI
jgi:hypothetical protein